MKRNRSKSKDQIENIENKESQENNIQTTENKIMRKSISIKNYNRRCNRLGVINEEEEPMSIKNSERNLFPINSKISVFNLKPISKANDKISTSSNGIDDAILSSTEGISELNSQLEMININTNLSEFDNDNKVINSLKRLKEILEFGKVKDVKPFQVCAKQESKSKEEGKCNIF